MQCDSCRKGFSQKLKYRNPEDLNYVRDIFSGYRHETQALEFDFCGKNVNQKAHLERHSKTTHEKISDNCMDGIYVIL